MMSSSLQGIREAVKNGDVSAVKELLSQVRWSQVSIVTRNMFCLMVI